MALTRLQSTRDFIRIWFIWKTNAVIIFLLIIGLVMLFAYGYTPDYESTAKILLLPRTSEGTIVSAGRDETRVASVSMEDINTEIELLTSGDVIKDTVRSFMKNGGGGGFSLKLPSTTWCDHVVDFIKKAINEILIFVGLMERLSPFDGNVNLLSNSIEVEPVAMSNIILVTLTAERPKAAAVVLDRLLDTYVKHHSSAFTKEERTRFFEEQASGYRVKLEAAEKKLKEFQAKSSIVDLAKQNEANIELLSDLRRELTEAEVLYDEIRSRIQILRKSLAENEHDIVITEAMRTIPSIVELEKSITSLLVKRSEIGSNFTPSSRVYKEVESQIEVLRGEIRNEIIKSIKTDELELKILLTKQKSLKNKIDGLQGEADSLNQKERILKELEREVELFRNNYMLYASKTEEARIYSEREKLDLANVSIADKADVSVTPVFPNRILMLVISVIVGFFAALGIPFLLEFLDHRLKSPDEVEALLSLPVVCAFPEIRN